MTSRQDLVKIRITDELPLLVADIFEAAGALRASGEQIARESGQTQARWQLLSAVSDTPRSVPDAARRLGVSRQAVQPIANELRDRGLATFVANPAHRTSPLIGLTPAGREVLDELTSAATARHRALAAQLDLDLLTSARDVLRVLIDAPFGLT